MAKKVAIMERDDSLESIMLSILAGGGEMGFLYGALAVLKLTELHLPLLPSAGIKVVCHHHPPNAKQSKQLGKLSIWKDYLLVFFYIISCFSIWISTCLQLDKGKTIASCDKSPRHCILPISLECMIRPK